MNSKHLALKQQSSSLWPAAGPPWIVSSHDSWDKNREIKECCTEPHWVNIRKQLKKNEVTPIAVLIAACSIQISSFEASKQSCRTDCRGAVRLPPELSKERRELDYKFHLALSQRSFDSSNDNKTRWTHEWLPSWFLPAISLPSRTRKQKGHSGFEQDTHHYK